MLDYVMFATENAVVVATGHAMQYGGCFTELLCNQAHRLVYQDGVNGDPICGAAIRWALYFSTH